MNESRAPSLGAEAEAEAELRRIGLVGNPNVGKTSLFNELTGARHRVGNYPGVTVERRSARLRSALSASAVELVDLPGCYSLTPYSEDEAVAFSAVTGLGSDDAIREPLDALIVVVDATNLTRNLYFALQVAQAGLPMVLALNMYDLARAHGVAIDCAALAQRLGCPVVPCAARIGEGLDALVAALAQARSVDAAHHVPFEAPATLAELSIDDTRARCLCAAKITEGLDWVAPTEAERQALAATDDATIMAAIEREVAARYQVVESLLAGLALAPSETAGEATTGGQAAGEPSTREVPAMRVSARIDAVVTHRLFGPLIFLFVMALVFQSIFTWADPAIGAIEGLFGALSEALRGAMGEGPLVDLLTDGVIAGVGNVVVFVPQIALLFLFIALLEDSGYMARAAFIIDRVMARVGLNGRSFVPLLSGYACAIPAIMGTRTIRRFRDRLVTILMIPFVSCSARLPIYALMIGALFEADRQVMGPFTLGGLILLSMYLLSTLSALAIGALYRRTILKGPLPPLVLELPPYRPPRVRSVLREVWDRCLDFLRDAGTIILAATIVLWGLLSYPKVDAPEASATTQIEQSYAGRVGKAMEPVLEPIGQNWRTGIGLIGSFAAREVFVSTLGLVYGIEGADEDDAPLREQIAEAKNPDGTKRYTPLRGLALMIFFVYAAQCMSTLAVVRRETRSWRWPLFMFASMTTIAYLASLLVYQGGRLLGFE